MVGHGVKSVISGYVVAYLLAAVGDVAANGAYAEGFGRDCGVAEGVGGVSVYRYVEGVEGEGEAAQGGVDAVGVAGGAYRGCAVGGGGVGSDNILFRFAAAKQQAMGGENQDYVEFMVHGGYESEMSAYSFVASKEGQALGAKSRCPYIQAPGYCALSFFRSWRRAVFCTGGTGVFGGKLSVWQSFGGIAAAYIAHAY